MASVAGAYTGVSRHGGPRTSAGIEVGLSCAVATHDMIAWPVFAVKLMAADGDISPGRLRCVLAELSAAPLLK